MIEITDRPINMKLSASGQQSKEESSVDTARDIENPEPHDHPPGEYQGMPVNSSSSAAQENAIVPYHWDELDIRLMELLTIGALKAGDGRIKLSPEKVEEDCKAKGKVAQEFSLSVILFGLAELLSVVFLPENSVDVDKLVVEAIATIGFTTLISGLASLIHTFFMQAHSKTCRNPIHHTISKGLTLVSGVDLVFASLLPVVLLPKPYKFLIPLVLIAVLLALGAHLYLRYRSVTDETKSDERDQSHDEELTKKTTRLSELSQVVFSLSSNGLLGLLFGIQKNASNHTHHPVVVVTVFLIFSAFMCSSVLIILCQTQLKHLSSSTSRETILKIGFGFCTFLLVLLAAAALAITYTFLQFYTLLAPVPASVVLVYWMGMKLCSGNIKQDDLGEEQQNWAYSMGNKVISISFGAIMIMFSGYLGSSSETTMHLNISMVFMASAFLSGLILMLISCKHSTISRPGIVVSVQTYYAITLLVFGVSTVFILEFVQLFATTSEVV